MANILRCAFDSKDEWPVKDVTVYEDRAQVVRILDYKTTDAGEAELKLNNLPTTIMGESIRAEISSPQGSVLAVTSETIRGVAQPTEPTEREMEIDVIIKDLNKESQVLNQRKTLLSSYYENMVPSFENSSIPSYTNYMIPQQRGYSLNQNNSLEQMLFSQQTTQTYNVNQNSILNTNCTDNKLFLQVSSNDNLDTFSEALNKYSKEQQTILKRQVAIGHEITKLAKEKSDSIKNRTTIANSTAKVTKDISVLVHIPTELVDESGILQVKLTYVVNDCGWKANYDVRVQKQEKKVDISYFGLVRNNSGEDWSEVQLFLSTAKPAREGNLPDLPRATVGYHVYEPPPVQQSLKSEKSLASFSNMRNVMPTSRRRMSMTLRDAMFDTVAVQQELEEKAVADKSTSQDRGGSATFKLNRLCTIASDNIPHKQSIGTVALNPQFTYVMTPQLSAFPYLLCTARNNSNFILVRGPMQVFFNGSYVTKTEMRLVNKNQEFRVFLGKDESIKMTITPQKSEKELKKGGIMTAKTNKETFTRKVLIENTSGEDVHILLYEQLPLARDNKIKVNILAPIFDEKSSNYKISNFNHLEAKRKIKAGKAWKFKFTYSVEWPKNTQVVYTESLENIEEQIK